MYVHPNSQVERGLDKLSEANFQTLAIKETYFFCWEPRLHFLEEGPRQPRG